MAEQLSLTIAARRDALESVVSAVAALGQREDWPDALVFKATLAVEELMLNIVAHGHDAGDREIEVTLKSEPERVTIDIVDDGRPFDLLQDAPAPDLTASLEERAVGGLGLHLVRSMMDEMLYKRERGKNHVALVALRDR